MNILKAKHLIPFLFFFAITVSYAQKVLPVGNSYEACQKLVDDALEDEKDKNYAAAYKKLLKAEILASENNWKDLLSQIKNRIGCIYIIISDFGEALDYFQESYALAQGDKNLYKNGISPLGNIGVLYAREEKYEEAILYFTKAYEIAKEVGWDERKKIIANNIADCYNSINNTKKSLEILKEVEEPVKSSWINFFWKGIYIETLLKNGKADEAEILAKQLYDELEEGVYEDQRDMCYTNITNLLSKIYTKLNKIDLAIMYGKKSLSTCEELSNRITFYENITRLYLQKSDYQTAFQYQDSAVQSKDSLANLINRSLYEMNKVKFQTQEYRNELKTEKERKQNQQKIFLGVTVFGLLLFTMIYMALRNNIIKQKHKAIITHLQLEKEREEHLSAEKELEINKLKQEQLKHEVAEKNREFTAKALYFTKRNKLIEDIIHSLEANSQKFGDKEMGSQIRSIKNILKADDQQEDFMSHFESVNPVFLKQLKTKHPELTANDIRFLCYVFMNLNIKEIADILNITYNACRKRRWKIQEKMGLDNTDSLYDYLFSV